MSLAYPWVNGGCYYLDTDASGMAIGAVLSQMQEGQDRMLAYGSLYLSMVERIYCIIQRKLLVVMYFMEYYRPAGVASNSQDRLWALEVAEEHEVPYRTGGSVGRETSPLPEGHSASGRDTP